MGSHVGTQVIESRGKKKVEPGGSAPSSCWSTVVHVGDCTSMLFDRWVLGVGVTTPSCCSTGERWVFHAIVSFDRWARHFPCARVAGVAVSLRSCRSIGGCWTSPTIVSFNMWALGFLYRCFIQRGGCWAFHTVVWFSRRALGFLHGSPPHHLVCHSLCCLKSQCRVS